MERLVLAFKLSGIAPSHRDTSGLDPVLKLQMTSIRNSFGIYQGFLTLKLVSRIVLVGFKRWQQSNSRAKTDSLVIGLVGIQNYCNSPIEFQLAKEPTNK